VLLSIARPPAETASAYVRLIRSDIIDGAIVMETLDIDPILAALEHREQPLIVLGYARQSALPAVYADDYGGAVQVMRYLLDLGHRRIGIVSSTIQPFGIEERLRGVKDTLTVYGLGFDQRLIGFGDFSVESGERVGRTLLERPDPPTAIFALNDRMALGVMRAAQGLGMVLPADLSIVGFDDISVASYATPPLTTVRQPGFAMGQAAAKAFFTRLAGQAPPAATVIPTKLVLRQSAVRPRSM
jgi:DNA-binding LacI/PurR family transcriptional regulator